MLLFEFSTPTKAVSRWYALSGQFQVSIQPREHAQRLDWKDELVVRIGDHTIVSDHDLASARVLNQSELRRRVRGFPTRWKRDGEKKLSPRLIKDPFDCFLQPLSIRLLSCSNDVSQSFCNGLWVGIPSFHECNTCPCRVDDLGLFVMRVYACLA